MRLILALLFTTSFLFAAEDPTPTLSSAGKKRLQSNLQTIEQNLENTKKNLETAKKNQETLVEEQKALEVLERDYGLLQKKYASYIATAEKELEKNDKAIEELSKYLGQIAGPSKEPEDKPSNPQTQRAQAEKTERETWKKESQAKIDNIKGLLNSTNESIKKIHARKGPIAHQLDLQAKKESEYEKLLKETETKKSEVQRLLSSTKQ